MEPSGMRNEKISGTVAEDPHCVEVVANPSDPSAKMGFLLWTGDGVKQVFCVTGPRFRGPLQAVGEFIELVGEHMGADFSFDEISAPSSPGRLPRP